MKSIRFGIALAMGYGLAGCATQQPEFLVSKPNLKAPAAKPAEFPRTVITALPEVARAPAPTYVPLRQPAQVLPQQVYQPEQYVRAAPAPAPQYAPAPPRYEAARVAPAPVVRRQVFQSIGDLDAPAIAEVAAPVSVFEPEYNAVAIAPAPVAVAPVTVAPVAVAPPVALAAAPRSRSMAPIYDDPKDGKKRSKRENRIHKNKGYQRNAALRAGGKKPKVRNAYTPAFGMELEDAALARLNPGVRYDPSYVKIGYPWGDVPETTGVCTDVIIRSYRTLGIDLQSLVHDDMRRAFRAYPSKRIYGLTKADPNIDHRRVVNLEAFFERTGASVPVGTSPDDFQPGDVLTWRLSGNEPHIGIVVSDRDPRTGYPLVVHNLGAGVRKDDLITLSQPAGQFRFAPDRATQLASLQLKR